MLYCSHRREVSYEIAICPYGYAFHFHILFIQSTRQFIGFFPIAIIYPGFDFIRKSIFLHGWISIKYKLFIEILNNKLNWFHYYKLRFI